MKTTKKSLPIFCLKIKAKFLNRELQKEIDWNFGYSPNSEYFDTLLEKFKSVCDELRNVNIACYVEDNNSLTFEQLK